MSVTLGVSKIGDWKKAAKILMEAPERIEAATKRALDQEALFLVGEIKKKLRAGPFKPLAKTTLLLRKLKGRKGTKPLIATSDMRNSVTKVNTDAGVFIGIPRTAMSKPKDGSQPVKYVDLADIHEHGRTFAIRVTAKMRRFWFAVLFKGQPPQGGGGGGSKGIIIIHIPARPFVRPVFEAEKDNIAGRLEDRLVKLLGLA